MPADRPPDSSSYIDYDAFLSPSFRASSFANTLVTSTNDASDTTVDLSTPLSKVLFDVQEVDTHIHTLSTRSALPLLEHARAQHSVASRITTELAASVKALQERYDALAEQVIRKHEVAEEVRLAVSRLWIAVKIGRAVQRALVLGRQLEGNMAEAITPPTTQSAPKSAGSAGPSTSHHPQDDHVALVRAANSLLSLKALLAASGPGEEGEHLSRITVVATLRTDLIAPAEQRLRQRAQQLVREFSLSSTSNTPDPAAAKPATTPAPPTTSSSSSFAQVAETRARTASACTVLYLLSPPPSPHELPRRGSDSFQPTLLIQALETYLRAALTASAASLGRALAALSTLPRALAEVSARCRNVAGLEKLLAGVETPEHPLLMDDENDEDDGREDEYNKKVAGAVQSATQNLLEPLLEHLDTSSLPSYFWRSLASELGPRVRDLLGRGGVGARQLRGAKDRIRDLIREAVLKGCEGARGPGGRAAAGPGAWEREVGVMVGSVVGPIGR